MIIGVSVVATMRLFASLTQQNSASNRVTTAMMLATNIQEAMIGLSFNDPGTAQTYFGPEQGETLLTWDDVDDFHGASLNPPIDSQRQPMDDMVQYTQVVSVGPVHMKELSLNLQPVTTDTGAVRVIVRILYQSTPGEPPAEVYRTSWIRVDN